MRDVDAVAGPLRAGEHAVRPPGRPPSSFGRPPSPENEEDAIRLTGGQAFHLSVNLDVTPSEESLAKLFDVIRKTTRQGVIAGYADAFAELDAPEEPAPGGEGAAAAGG